MEVCARRRKVNVIYPITAFCRQVVTLSHKPTLRDGQL